MSLAREMGRLRRHLFVQQQRAVAAGDRIGEAVLGRVLDDFATAVSRSEDTDMAKIDISKVLMMVAAVQQFVSTVQANYKGTSAQKKAAIVQAVKDALPLVESLTGKDLLDNAKFITAVSGLADLFIKAPAK